VPNSADPSTAGRVNDPRDHATPADAVTVGPCAPAIPLNADVLSTLNRTRPVPPATRISHDGSKTGVARTTISPKRCESGRGILP
jgi:hypothetical protein